MAALFNEGSLICGGALISDRYVLTAGHCINKLESYDEFYVGLGIHDLFDFEGGVVMSAIEVKLHPDFKFKFLRDINDLALLKLSDPVDYTRNIRPVCLPTQDRNYTNSEVEVTGWGYTSRFTEEVSRYLKQTTLEVISSEKCANTKAGPFLDENMMCTYTEHTDACQGDSGGPLDLQRQPNKYETIGIVSWGFGCAARGSPGVNTKVFNYLDWILSSTEDSIYCNNEWF